MKLEHCHKCKKQLEFAKKKSEINSYDNSETRMTDNCELKMYKDNSGATFNYCNGCYYDLKMLLSVKGFIKQNEVE